MKLLRIGILSTLLLVGSVSAQTEDTDSVIDSLRLAMLETRDRLDGINENLAVVNSDLAILKWLKVSGYVQARWELIDTLASFDKASPDAFRNNTQSNIYIRRGRVKFTFTPHNTSRYVFYIDASKNTISLKEAYVELMKSFNYHSFALTVGQQNIPFGYEIEYSSSQRDFPERSLAENVLFKGERDRGINLSYAAPEYFLANIGVFQGYGIEDRNFTWWDPTKEKAVIARARGRFGMLDLGVSGYWGDNFQPGTAAVPASTTWRDTDGDFEVDPNEVTNVAAKPAVPGIEAEKNRLGADAQVYLDLLPIGASAIRTEYFWGEDFNSKVAEDSLAGSQGWYIWLSQAITTKFGAAVRYNYWDPNTETAANDAIGTWSFAFHYFFDPNVRITAAYDISKTLKGESTFSAIENDPQDNRFTLQFQFAL